MMSFPFVVLYMDQTYDEIKGDYIFPQGHIYKYMQQSKTLT